MDILFGNRENKLAVQIENGILKHLSTLESEFERYFPEIANDKLDFVRNPFTFSVKKLSDECQNKFLELVSAFIVRQAYHEKLLTQFCIEMKDPLQKLPKKLCTFLFLICLRTCVRQDFLLCYQSRPNKEINWMFKDDLHCALSQTIPRIQQLSNDKQTQVLH